MTISSKNVKDFIEQTFDKNISLYLNVALSMGNPRPQIPDLKNNQTYHPKRVFKIAINAKNIAANKFNIFNNNEIDVFKNGAWTTLNLSDVVCVRGFNLCVVSYDYAVLVVEDKNGSLYFGKVIKQ